MDCIIVHGVAKSQTQLSDFHFNTSFNVLFAWNQTFTHLYLPYETLSFLKKMTTSYSSFYCWKGGPFQGLRVGSRLTLGNKLSKEIHVIKARDFIGKGSSMKSRRVRNPEELLCHVAHSLRFSGDGVYFRVVSGQSFSFRVFLVVHASLSQDGFQQEGFWEDTWTCIFLCPFELS